MPTYPIHRQSGAALIVSLILLLVMTLLGVSAMQTNVLEEKMAGNHWRTQLAFQAAERGLREAEQAVLDQATDGTALDFSLEDGFYLESDAIDPAVRDWSSLNYESPGGDRFYVVEYLGCRDLPGNSVKLGPTKCQSGTSQYLFRIWSRGSEGTSVRILQTHYTTDAPL